MRLAVFIGPDKAGSSWIHRYFELHPECFASRSKEIGFFRDHSVHARGTTWYKEQFHSSTITRVDDALYVDVDHDTMFSPFSSDRVSAIDASTKLICLTRDPLKRAYSSFKYMKYQGRLPEARAFREAFEHAEGSELIMHGMYYHHLRPFLARFPREAIYVRSFEAFFGDVERSAADLSEFLEIDAQGVEARSIGIVRQARAARSRAGNMVGRYVLSRLRDAGRHDLAFRLKESRTSAAVSMRRRSRSSTESDLENISSQLASIWRRDALELQDNFGPSATSGWSWVLP